MDRGHIRPHPSNPHPPARRPERHAYPASLPKSPSPRLLDAAGTLHPREGSSTFPPLAVPVGLLRQPPGHAYHRRNLVCRQSHLWSNRRPGKIASFPMREEVKRKKLPAPPQGEAVWLASSPIARCLRLDMNRPVAVISRRFHVSDGSTPSAREAVQAEVLAPDELPTMIL